MSFLKSPAAAMVGLVLTRIVVPAWILTGAVFKLLEHTPKLLPKSVFEIGTKTFDFSPLPYLATLIALEFFAVAVMVCLAKFARSMAIFMLSTFCLILMYELSKGSSSCGCLGANSPHPGFMLALDGGLLLGVILFAPGPGLKSPISRGGLVSAALLTIAGAVASYGVILPLNKPVGPGGGGGGQPAGPTPIAYDPATRVNPSPESLPPVYYVGHDAAIPEAKSWEGEAWWTVDLLRAMPVLPKGLDQGTRYVIFYGRTCDHCEEMFNFTLTDPNWAAEVTAVEVPASTTKMRDENAAWEMIPVNCELMELPLGPDYVITTPLILKVVDGVIECADEGSHEHCMGLEHDH